MDLCPDSVGGGWKTKTESLARELGKNLLHWKHGAGANLSTFGVLKGSGSWVLVSGAGTALPISLASSHSSESLKSHFPIPLRTRIRQRWWGRRRGSDNRAALSRAPCVASSCRGSVSPHKMTNSRSLPPGVGGRRRVGRIKTTTATKCKVITTIRPERLSALAHRLLPDTVLRAFPAAALSDGAHSVLLWHRCLRAWRVEQTIFLPQREKVNLHLPRLSFSFGRRWQRKPLPPWARWGKWSRSSCPALQQSPDGKKLRSCTGSLCSSFLHKSNN